MISNRVPRQCLDWRGRSVEDNRCGHSSREHETGGEREPAAGQRPRMPSVHGRLMQLIAQAVRELPGWLQFRGAIEGGAEDAAQPTSRLNVRPTRRTGLEMPQDFVIRFRQQFLTEKRIGNVPNVTTIHDASIL
jgi:hypothetical protein